MSVYEEATKRWVAEKLEITDWTEIESIKFGTEHERCGMTCACEDDVPIIFVLMKTGPRWIWPNDANFDLMDMLAGIAELAVSLQAPSPTGTRSLQDEASNAYQAAKKADEERNKMRDDLQGVIRTARGALARHVAALEWLGQGIE